MATRTYYEILNDTGLPAIKAQASKLGTPRYGYASRVVAELHCPNECDVCERFSDGCDDWSGRTVSSRLSDGTLIRYID